MEKRRYNIIGDGMMKKKRLFILIGGVTVLLGAVVIFDNLIDTYNIKKNLTNIATDYYDNELSKLLPGGLAKYKEFKLDLNSLKNAGKDLSLFEKENCDFENTYVTFKYIKNNDYEYEVNIKC